MTVRKIMVTILFFVTAALAAEYLVKVDLDAERLTPLFEDGLRPIAELDNTALVLVADNETAKLSGYSFQIIAQDPQPDEYYLVSSYYESIDLDYYGDILMTDGTVHLLRLHPGMLEPLTRERVDLLRLMFTPIIR
ncbi:MAG: hypothetical protein JSU64_04905, partial [candidate division WOR-3 bacterium]